MNKPIVSRSVFCFALMLLLASCHETDDRDPSALFRTADLNLGESQVVELSDGSSATVELLEIVNVTDSVSHAVRLSQISIVVNGDTIAVSSANYSRPLHAGHVQIDCPITSATLGNSRSNPWALEKDARVRLWPANSPWMPDDEFSYPIDQKWFASYTQMANEPVHVDGGEVPGAETIYYHSGLDFGGAEALVEALSAIDGTVVTAGDSLLTSDLPDAINPRYDVIYLRDARGWYYRYSHLYSFADGILPGVRVKQKQPIGLLGKEGGSGGWSHLHFEIVGPQPSGKYGTIEGYPFIWEAYVHEVQPDIIAHARPHHVIWSGDSARLDARRSWSSDGTVASYEWQFSDGSTGVGSQISHRYTKPGTYAEVLKVTDGIGRVAFDIASVQVFDKDHPDRLPPTIHPAYSPTTGIRSGTPVVFKVRSFRTTAWGERWDFGDGSRRVRVRSDGNRDQHATEGYAVVEHSFELPGTYIVSVEHLNEWGYMATGKLVVEVE